MVVGTALVGGVVVGAEMVGGVVVCNSVVTRIEVCAGVVIEVVGKDLFVGVTVVVVDFVVVVCGIVVEDEDAMLFVVGVISGERVGTAESAGVLSVSLTI